MSSVQQIIQQLIVGQSVRSGKWLSLNARCCTHNGNHRPDTKQRGGFMFTADGGVGFSCFNCGFRARYSVGGYLSTKMKSLMQWHGASSQDILQAIMIAREVFKPNETDQSTSVKVNIQPRDLPKDAAPFEYWVSQPTPPIEFQSVLMKMNKRNPSLLDLSGFWWSPSIVHGMNSRFIVPFFYNNEPIGYTARSVDDVKLRFWNQYSDSVIYNIDALSDPTRNCILIHEAPIDAMFTRGVAICHYHMKETQLDILDRSDKVKVVVPDRDKDGRVFVHQAVQRGWSVAFPDWGYIEIDGVRRLVKDTEEAVRIYGRAFATYMIYDSILSSPLHIKTKTARWFKGIK